MDTGRPSADFEGTTTFFDGEYNATTVTVTICCALGLYNATELLILVFTTFRRYAGLYFWSLSIASVGIIPYVIGFALEYFQLAPQLAGEIIATIGWPMMVTGQSLVLYSRLGVVLGPNHDRMLRAIKWMIVADGLVFHISTTVVMFGAYNAHPAHQFALAYQYIEKIQMTGFTLQEFIISGIYVWSTLNYLKDVNSADDRNTRPRRTMIKLFGINAVIIVFDIALLVVEYQDRHVIEEALKCVVYSIKLKLEFAVLSSLVNISKRRVQTVESTFGDDEIARGTSCISNNMLFGFISGEKQEEHGDTLHLERL